jgi:NifU-like protein involved in Fe-S cluster formation
MDGEVVQELSFQGSGCAISKASALLLTKNADTAPSALLH